MLVVVATVTSPAWSVEITVDWQQHGGIIDARAYGLNLWDGTDPTRSSSPLYQDKVEQLSPGIARLHATGILNPMGRQAWVDVDFNWVPDTIDQVLGAVTSRVGEVMLTVPDWPTAWDGPDGRLAPDRVGDYADFVADLVDIANVQLGHRVTWIETFNERDGAYDGDIAALAAVHNAVAAAVRAVDPTIQVAAGAWTQPFDNADIQSFMAAVGPANMDAFTYHHYATSGTSTDRAFLYEKAETVGDRGDVLRGWLDGLPGGEDVELWLGETNLYTNFANDTQRLMRDDVGAVWDALMHRRVLTRGEIEVVQPWNDSDNTYGKIIPGGPGLRPAGHVRALMVEHFIGEWAQSDSTEPTLVESLAVADQAKRAVMLINRSLNEQTVEVSLESGEWVGTDITLKQIGGPAVLTTGTATASDGVVEVVMPEDAVVVLLYDAVPVGDFDRSGLLDAADIDALLAMIAAQASADSRNDLNGDGVLTEADGELWITSLAGTTRGDANLDGVIDQSDLDAVLQNWGGTDTGWARGDFDGGGQVEQGDLDLVLQQWGFQAGPTLPVSSVPEPFAPGVVLVGFCLICRRWRASRCGVRRD